MLSRNQRATTVLLSRLASLPHSSSRTAPQNTVQSLRFFSTTPSSVEDTDDDGPWGDLFGSNVGLELLHKKASIRRTFDARSNALGLLTCGGEALAKHASFDPEYERARGWIQHHAVGPAVLSPVLISGLVGALVEASLPQAVVTACSMRQIRPLIVGVEVCATIEVVSVEDPEVTEEVDMPECGGGSRQDLYERSNGFEVCLRTEVARVRDDATIASGTHSIWIPDYLHM